MSETKAQHPERRAEQRWRSEATIGGKPYVVEGTLLRYENFGQQLGNGWHLSAATVNGKLREDGGYVFYDKNWAEEHRPMTILSDVPAAAPLAADRCKAPEWCGMTSVEPDKRDQAFFNSDAAGFVVDGHIYCSKDGAHVTPPLAAQPAETKPCNGRCMTSVGTMDRPAWKVCAPCGEKIKAQIEAANVKPAPQPAPACAYGCSDTQANTACPTHGKPAPAKPACERGANLHGGPVLLRCTGKGLFRKLCEHCYLAIEPLQKGPCGDVLHESDVPERLERPKLAHSSMWADEAEDVR